MQQKLNFGLVPGPCLTVGASVDLGSPGSTLYKVAPNILKDINSLAATYDRSRNIVGGSGEG